MKIGHYWLRQAEGIKRSEKWKESRILRQNREQHSFFLTKRQTKKKEICQFYQNILNVAHPDVTPKWMLYNA